MFVSKLIIIIASIVAVVAVAVIVWLAFFRAPGYGKDGLTGMMKCLMIIS